MKDQILRAQPADALRLKEIAVAAKAYWGYPPEWMERWTQRFQVRSEYLAANEVYKLVRGDAIIGWYAVVLRGPTALLDDLWVEPTFIGQGLGRVLFVHARQLAQQKGAQRLELEADPNAVGFYEHMGATIVGEVESDMGRKIPIMTMQLTQSL